MVSIIRNADNTIKTYSEKGEDFFLAPGETMEEVEGSFADYAGRLKISANGRSGETLFLPAGTLEVEVWVDCPGKNCIALEINNEEKSVMLADGRGSFSLPLVDGMSCIIRPRDCREYCPAGEAIMVVVVAGPGA
jgi:hypothetical protein